MRRRRASGQHYNAGNPRNGAVYLGGVYLLLLAAQHAVDARHCTAPAQAAGRLAVVASFALIAFAGLGVLGLRRRCLLPGLVRAQVREQIVQRRRPTARPVAQPPAPAHGRGGRVPNRRHARRGFGLVVLDFFYLLVTSGLNFLLLLLLCLLLLAQALEQSLEAVPMILGGAAPWADPAAAPAAVPAAGGDEVVIEYSTADATFAQKEIHRFRVC
jgi:hypothetical protein